MGIFKFFKKDKQTKQSKEKEIVSQDKIHEWFLNKKKQHQEKEQEFLIPIKERISQLISELKLEISALENVDIDSKKVEFRIKLIIKENLKNYLEYLRKMMDRLSEINKREKIIEKINFIFDEFKRKSEISYQKITFLIGKEMQATKTSMNNFLKDLEKILKNNSKEFKEYETIKVLEKYIRELQKIEENKNNFLKDLKEGGKVKSLEQNIKDKEEEIKFLQQSDKFKKEEEKRKELELKKQKLEKDINALKMSINFKALSNFYHKFENEMKLVKEYKEKFRQTLKDIKTSNLINLLKESKLDSPKILELIQSIENNKKEISEMFIDNLDLEKLENKIERIKSRIQTIEVEKLVKGNKIKILNQNLNKILKEIKEILEKINIKFLLDI